MRDMTAHQPGYHLERTWLCHGLTVMSTRGGAIAKLRLAFDVGAMYMLDGGDQYDWNKAGGLAPMLTLDGMSNKAMVVWRWVPSEQLFHVGLYWHPLGGGRVMPEDNGTLMKVAAGTPVVATIEARWRQPYRAHLVCADGVADVACEGTVSPLVVRNVFGYFGGNRVAPRAVTYESDRIYLSKRKIRIGL